MRTFGVEEEYLLIDPETGSTVAAASNLLRAARLDPSAAELVAEFQQEMVETATPPREHLDRLEADVASMRTAADRAARNVGARIAALASSPLAVQPHLTEDARYREMASRFQLTARHSLTCGFHVHVGIGSAREGVAILDRIRDWLSVLVALSANSPMRDGEDTGFASYRTIAWREWPTAGPTDLFGSPETYESFERSMLATGVPLDHGMLYFDARLSRNNPTIEVRVSDVCLRQGDAVTLAALVRALVETAIRERRDGMDPAGTSSAVLRLASWQAAREGLTGGLVHPQTGGLEPAAHVLDALLAHVGAALETTGDRLTVEAGIARMLSAGTGAQLQRETLEATGIMAEVVRQAIQLTQEH